MPGNAAREGQAMWARSGPGLAVGLVLAQPQARAVGNSGRICICVPGRGRAPGLLVNRREPAR